MLPDLSWLMSWDQFCEAWPTLLGLALAGFELLRYELCPEWFEAGRKRTGFEVVRRDEGK